VRLTTKQAYACLVVIAAPEVIFDGRALSVYPLVLDCLEFWSYVDVDRFILQRVFGVVLVCSFKQPLLQLSPYIARLF